MIQYHEIEIINVILKLHILILHIFCEYIVLQVLKRSKGIIKLITVVTSR